MTKTERIEKMITYLFGEVGHAKGNFYYEVWLNHHAVVQVVNDAGGCTDVITASTPTKLIEKLDAISNAKRFLK